MKSSLTILSFLLFQMSLVAQGNWVNYTNCFNVWDVEETEDGIWVASTGGLYFSNNQTNEQVYFNRGNSKIPSNNVKDLFLTENDVLWVTTDRGICQYINEEFIAGPTYITGEMNMGPDGRLVVANQDKLYIQENEMNFIEIDYPQFQSLIGGFEINKNGDIIINGVAFFGQSYVAIYKEEQWQTIYLENNYSTALAMDDNDVLWFLTKDGLFNWLDEQWNYVTGINVFSGGGVRDLHVDVEGNIVMDVKTVCPEILKWNGEELTKIDYASNDCVNDYLVKPSTKKKNHFFGANYLKGIFTFSDTFNNDYLEYSQSPLCSNFIVQTLHPKDGSHIVVTPSCIQKVEDEMWSEIPLPSNLEYNIQIAILRKDQLCISDGKKIWVYEDQGWKEIELPENDFSSNIYFMTASKSGVLWIGGGLRIARYDEDWTVFAPGDMGMISLINEMKVDPKNGDLWVATPIGVKHYDGEFWTLYEMPFDYDVLLIAVSEKGVYIYTKYVLYLLKDGVIEQVPSPSSPDFKLFTYDILYDDERNHFYVVGKEYLAIYKDEEWIEYDLYNSMIYNGFTNKLNLDIDGNLWLAGAGNGVEVLDVESVVSNTEEYMNEDFTDEIRVYPTIIQSDEIQVESKKGGVYKVSLISVDGSLIYSSRVELAAGLSQALKLPVVQGGVFFLQFSDGEGRVEVKRIVVVE